MLKVQDTLKLFRFKGPQFGLQKDSFLSQKLQIHLYSQEPGFFDWKSRTLTRIQAGQFFRGWARFTEILDSQELQAWSISLQFPIYCYCLLLIFEYFAPSTWAFGLISYFTHQIEPRIVIQGFENFLEESRDSCFVVWNCVPYSLRTLWSAKSYPRDPLGVDHWIKSFLIRVAWCIFGAFPRCCAWVPLSDFDPSVLPGFQEFHCTPSFKLPCSQSAPWMLFHFQESAHLLGTSW